MKWQTKGLQKGTQIKTSKNIRKSHEKALSVCIKYFISVHVQSVHVYSLYCEKRASNFEFQEVYQYFYLDVNLLLSPVNTQGDIPFSGSNWWT
jgi:hypothetical protein